LSWLKKIITGPVKQPRRTLPDGVWLKCKGCGEILYRQEMERSLWVCSHCGVHFRLTPPQYLSILTDDDSWRELFTEIRSTDPLNFRDGRGKYKDKLKKAQKDNPSYEAVQTGVARVKGIETAMAIMDFSFLGGSMGSVVGERIARLIALARDERFPVVILSCSGGARMHEGVLSLMQMAKTCAELARLSDAGLPFISILTDPTTGGVSASFATLGDVILAEPGALIGFAGPRVIRETIGQELPEGFQRAEFLLAHGFVDQVVPRDQLRDVLGRFLKLLTDSRNRGTVIR
jgi:acetyl-CoA carboxylase carboxyl transferase subunit beta